MFYSSKKKMVFTAPALIILLFLSIMGCGHDSKSEQNIDPADAYKGKTSKATVTSENARNLASGGYGGKQIGVTLMGAAKTRNTDEITTEKSLPVLQLVQIIKQSTIRMEIAKKEDQSKAVARQGNYVENGDDGGTASFVIDVNDSTGNFSGTITYADYSTDGITINGSATVTGTYNFDMESPSGMTLTFNALTINFGAPYGITLTGTLSWNSNFATDTDTISMNMTLLDEEDGKTYWFNSYEITTIYNDNGFSQTITGRYYDHDYGFVDLSTLVTLFTYNIDVWRPSEGSVLLKGDAGTWVLFSFFEYSQLIEADTNGDDDVDWQHETEVIDIND